MALDTLGVTFVFQIDDYLFQLFKGSGTSNREVEQIEVTLSTNLSTLLNDVKLLYWAIGYFPSAILYFIILCFRNNDPKITTDKDYSNDVLLCVFVFSIVIE